jgi:outer membrane protein assembly factor BamD
MLAAAAGCLTLLLAGGVTGCASTSIGKGVSYDDSAEANYKKGLAELEDESFTEAIKYFSYVKNKFPFSRFATLAELGIADTYFAQEKYMEAVDAYRMFEKFHPTHPKVTSGYTSYKIAKAYMEQIPTDWFLVPPSHEKDQAATRDALRAIKSFLSTHEDSKYLPKVKKLHRRAIRRLADHELYVARFYLERDKPKATILRLETLLRRYPDAGVDPEVMLLLGKTYLKLDKKKRARETFAKLIRKYPDNSYSAKAKLYLKHMSGERE